MKVLGEIKAICSPRVITTSNGEHLAVRQVIFHGEGHEFVGDMWGSEEGLTKRGVVNGAIGKMEIEFKVREAKRSTGDTYPVQSVRFTRFTAANMGAFSENVPAASGAPAEDAAPSAPVEATEVKQGDEPF